MKQILFIIVLLYAFSGYSQTSFVKPWNNTTYPIVIDVYKDNAYEIKDVLKDTRIKGIIHKMSEEDNASYIIRRKESGDNNLLFGSYWLPKYDTNGAAQADVYLKMIGNAYWSKELIALDFEKHKKTGSFISPENAYLFVERIHEKTGRYPYIYCGLNNINSLIESKYRETFLKCKLWIIALRKSGDVSSAFTNPKSWSTYSLWQFSCEINCCGNNHAVPCFYKTPRVDCYMDYDVYNGSFEDLKLNWSR